MPRRLPRVTADEIRELKPQIPEWKVVRLDDIERLERTFKFDNFQKALDFTNAVGAMAEAEDHHPKLTTEWGRVNVMWWTHKIRGLHRNDLVAAAKTDQIYAKK